MVPLKLIQVSNGCIYDDPECLPFVHEHDHYHSTGLFLKHTSKVEAVNVLYAAVHGRQS